ncbi:MAG: DUF2964 family protein [Chloroflexi bacterium]|nr:DUF2964 family protein [Chloroflexota bacterium]
MGTTTDRTPFSQGRVGIALAGLFQSLKGILYDAQTSFRYIASALFF